MPKTKIFQSIARSGQFTFSQSIGGGTATFTNIANVTHVNERGAPTTVRFMPFDASADSYFSTRVTGASVVTFMVVQLKRNGVMILSQTYEHVIVGASTGGVIPASAFQYTDPTPPAGSNLYQIDVTVGNNGAGSFHDINNFCLEAAEQI